VTNSPEKVPEGSKLGGPSLGKSQIARAKENVTGSFWGATCKLQMAGNADLWGSKHLKKGRKRSNKYSVLASNMPMLGWALPAFCSDIDE